MTKVTLEFNEEESKEDLKFILNRNKIMTALYDLSDLYSKIYNHKISDEEYSIYLKEDGTKATDEDYKKVLATGQLLSGGTYYLNEEKLLNDLDNIIDNFRDLLLY